jgi:hypothetical protein
MALDVGNGTSGNRAGIQSAPAVRVRLNAGSSAPARPVPMPTTPAGGRMGRGTGGGDQGRAGPASAPNVALSSDAKSASQAKDSELVDVVSLDYGQSADPYDMDFVVS